MRTVMSRPPRACSRTRRGISISASQPLFAGQELFFWPRSTIYRAVIPCVAAAVLWALIFLVLHDQSRMWSHARGGLLRITPVGLTLQGTAIGLLLVFRTNNSYQRLAEARGLWGRAIYLIREMVQTVGAVLNTRRGEPLPPCAASIQLVRCCAAFGWVLKAKLRDGEECGDVLETLLPTVGKWVASQRNPPVALVGCMRRVIQAEYEAQRLPVHLHYKLEEDIKELDLVVGGCERLFSSPISTSMSRHVVRSLALWLLTLPVVLVGQLSSLLVVFYVAATAYIYIGIEELGVQVEQPFDVLPMFQMAHVVATSAEDALAMPGCTQEL